MADNTASHPTTPRDEHAKALKQATSQVKQLRTRVLSDPAKADELVDQLNESTALRLLAHRWAEAVAEAQEAVQASDRLVASRGPVGPYTPMADAARYFTALGHVARLQAGLGLPAAGAQTAEVAYGWAGQLTSPDLPTHLSPRSCVLTLLAVAAGRLASGDVADANAHADAAVARAREAGFAEDAMLLPLLVDALSSQADARWAANLPDDSIQVGREALQRWQDWTRTDLQQLPRMTKAHLDRVAAPLVALQRDLADRLAATGDNGGSLALREEMADLLHKMAARRSEQGRIDLALARADQAEALLTAGQLDQASQAAESALDSLQKLYKLERPVGSHLPVQVRVAPSIARVEAARGQLDSARRTMDGVFSRLAAHPGIDVPVAARARAQLVRHEVLAAAGDPGAGAALAEFDRLAAEVRSSAPADVDDRTLVEARARGVVLRGTGAAPHWHNLADDRSLAASTRTVASVGSTDEQQLSDEELLRHIDEQREAEARERAVAELRAAAERSERQRREREDRAAKLAEVEPREAAELEHHEAAEVEHHAEVEAAAPAQVNEPAGQAEREPAPLQQDEPQPERAEVEVPADQEETTSQVEAHETPAAQHAPEPVTDPLDLLRQEVRDAQATASKDAQTTALERLAQALETRAGSDPSLRVETVRTLERLADLQGWWGGRGTGRHAKQLARQWDIA